MVGHVGNSYRPHNFCPNPQRSRVGKTRQESARVGKSEEDIAYLLICLFEGEEEEYARTMEGVSENAR